MIYIKKIFTIGYRCNCDRLLDSLNIRNYSSPFSYMVIDLYSAISFINNNFINFLDVKKYDCHNFKWKNRKWNHTLFFNKLFLPETDDCKCNELKRIICWNHHNLGKNEIKEAIKRRCTRFINNIDNETLLVHFSRTVYKEQTISDMVTFLNDNNKYNANILLIIPFYNYNKNNEIYKINKKINIIKIKPNFNHNDNDIKYIDIDNIKNIIFKTYKFNLYEYKDLK